MRGLDLNEISQTRITWELQKLFLGDFYAHGIFAMCQLDLFEKLLHVKVSPSQARVFSKRLLRYKSNLPQSLKPYFWLFFFLDLTKMDSKALLAHLGLGRAYERMLVNVPFGNPKMSDYELMEIAIDRPLKSWVGICYPNIKKRAIDLGIYEKVFDGGVDVQSVIMDGFCGKNIGKELRRRILHVAKEKTNS
jgi:tRNA nucleotidyltransferase (CCA-adding enzyme)